MHISLLLLLCDAGDGGLRVRGQDAGLRVDDAQRTEHERLVLRGRDGRDRRVPRERRWRHTNTHYTTLPICRQHQTNTSHDN